MDECQEHLLTLNQSILELEHNPENSSILDRIFRAAHTLKGASATMGFNKMANLTHAMEDVLSKLRSKELSVTTEIVNSLFQAIDLLEVLATKIGEGIEEDIEITGAVQDLRRFVTGEQQVQPTSERRQSLQLRYQESEKEQIQLSIDNGFRFYHLTVTLVENCLLKGARVFMVLRDVEKLGSIIRSFPSVKDLEDENFDLQFLVGVISQSNPEEFVAIIGNITDVAKVVVDEPKLEQLLIDKRVQEVTEQFDNKKTLSTQTVRVDIKKLDDLMNLVSELVISRSQLETLVANISSKDLNEVVEQFGRITIDLRDSVMKTRMVPIETVFSRFPRLIRDLGQELGKEIDLEIRGGETELDRTLIDEIGDPLVHIIRNAVDHGIENAEERIQNDKSPNGKITLNAYQEGNGVVISVIDDGRGFNVKKVKDKAISLGLITPEAVADMTDQQILGFTFLPGFSTAQQITDLSGRGVGMDVVKTKVEELKGIVSIDSKLGQGSIITIRLPLTLAIIQTLTVQLGKEMYAIPSGYIEAILNLNRNEIKRIHKQEVFMFRGEVLPLIRLQDVLDTPGALNNQLDELDIVVLRIGDRLVGCVVDGLHSQRDVVIKSLGGYLGTIKGIAGATILGDGKVVLILDIRSVA
jgi:two-component system chemotaxis sensor kinase CheA